MSLEAHLTEEGLLPQAVELRRLVEMKFQLIEVEAEVVMRSSLTSFWHIICLLPLLLLSLRAHFDDRLLFVINFDSDFLVASLCQTRSP